MDENKHYLQIDIIKALAIVSVIIVHTVPTYISSSLLSTFTLEQAVPVFLLIMGLNAGMSFKRRGFTTLSQMYSWNYFQIRLTRFLIPFVIIFFISIILGLLFDKTLYFGILTFIGYIPLSGPGNYFISLVLQFIFIFPLLYYIYKRNPVFLLVSAFILSFVCELVANHISIFENNSYIYRAFILRYIFVIVLGIYAIDNLNTHNLNSIIKNKVFMIGLGVSVVYMVLVSFVGWNISFFQSSWQPGIFISFFYTLFLCAILIRYLPSISTKIWDKIALIGKASYHIYLIQILFFGIGLSIISLFIKSFVIILIWNIVLILCLGILFYLLEKRILQK